MTFREYIDYKLKNLPDINETKLICSSAGIGLVLGIVIGLLF